MEIISYNLEKNSISATALATEILRLREKAFIWVDICENQKEELKEISGLLSLPEYIIEEYESYPKVPKISAFQK